MFFHRYNINPKCNYYYNCYTMQRKHVNNAKLLPTTIVIHEVTKFVVIFRPMKGIIMVMTIIVIINIVQLLRL